MRFVPIALVCLVFLALWGFVAVRFIDLLIKGGCN